MDRVVSSYSVSLNAFVRSQKSIQSKRELQPGVHDRKPESIALVAMEELHNAPKEVRRVANICRSVSTSTPGISLHEVLKALKCCDIFHFAGHGTSNQRDPSDSALILRNPDRLTVSNLFEVNLHKRKPFLAFLSACSARAKSSRTTS
jgi:CHAT domain-containing protein